MAAKAFTIVQFQTADDFVRGWKSLNGRTKSIERDMHTLAMATLGKYLQENDTGLVELAMAEIRTSQRKDKLGEWFSCFGVALEVDRKGAVTIDKSAEGKAERKRIREDDAARQEIMNKANEVPFWEFKAQGGGQTFDLKKKAATLAKAALKEGLDPADVIAAMNEALVEAQEASKAKGKA